MSTTNPPIANANRTVSSGVTMPPARTYVDSRDATVASAGSSSGSTLTSRRRRRRAFAAPAAGHGHAEVLLGGVRGQLGDDLALVDDQHPVAQRPDLLELQRHHQHRLARIALGDEPPV